MSPTPAHEDPLLIDGELVEVRRSARRRRTVSARRENGRVVVLMPDRLSRREEERWLREMVAKVKASESRRRSPSGDSELHVRALDLQSRFLAHQLDEVIEPLSVTWSTSQNTRWGSCTPEHRTIRLSHRLKSMPSWVVDYVLLHELTHLSEFSHSARFWRLLQAYPRTEEAKGYLNGWSDALNSARSGDPGPHPDDDPHTPEHPDHPADVDPPELPLG